MTPERKAEVQARIDEILGPRPKPKLAKVVAVDGRVVRDADVRVSRADPNARNGETIAVRRPGVVTVNLAEAERQYWEGVRDREAERRYRRQIDPYDYGHWGPRDE